MKTFKPEPFVMQVKHFYVESEELEKLEVHCPNCGAPIRVADCLNYEYPLINKETTLYWDCAECGELLPDLRYKFSLQVEVDTSEFPQK